MAIRRFGPVKGAGTVIVEKTGQESIEAAAMGIVAVVGPWERGMVSTAAAPKINYCSSRGQVDKKMGGRIPSSLCPDVAQDYFQHSEGAGEVLAVRVTDGEEEAAQVDLYSRHWGTDFHTAESQKDNQPQVKIAVLRIKAKNGGRWGGALKQKRDSLTVATDVEETTIDTGDMDMVANAWVGATLVLKAVESKTYTVVGNDASGVVTVKSDSTMLTDLGAAATTEYSLILDNEVLSSGARKGLGAVIKEAEVSPEDNFGMDVYVDGEIVLSYPTLSMLPTSAYYAENIVNKDGSNYYFEVEDLIPPGSTITPDLRPADFYGRLAALTSVKATFATANVIQVPTNCRVVSARMLEPVSGFEHLGFRLTLTWNLGATKYTVSCSPIRHAADYADTLFADFVVGAATQYHKTYTVDNYVEVILDHEGAVADGEQMVVDFLPVHNRTVTGAYIVPDAKNAPLTRLRITEGDFESTTIESGDLEPQAASTLASVTGTKAETFTIVAGVNDKLKITADGYTEIVVTLIAGAARTAAQVVTDINTAFDAVFGASVYLIASATIDLMVKLASKGFAGSGSRSTVKLAAVAHDAYTTLGFSAGTYSGEDSTGPETGVLTGTIAGPYAIVAVTNETMEVQIDGRTSVVVTLTTGAARTAAQIVSDINTAFDAIFGAGNLNPASVYTDALGATYVRLSGGVHWGGGPGSSVALLTELHDAYATLGFPPSTETPVIRGLAGNEMQMLQLDEPGTGHDGGTPTDQDYIDALSVSNSPLNRIAGKGKGVVQIITPGVTSPTVQKAGVAYGEAKNHLYLCTIPESVTDEQDAVNYVNDTLGRSDFILPYFPSYADVLDPDGEGALKRIPVHGMITGRDALYAKNYLGYFRPAAGQDCTLPRVVRLPTTELDGEDKVLNEEVLNPQGLNVVKKVKGNYVVWGARIAYRSSTFKFKCHRLQLSHYEHTFMESFDWVIFALNNKALRAQLISTFQGFFLPEYAKGAIVGDKFTDAVWIKADAENNPPTEIAMGNAHVDISVALADIAERLIITISRRGLFETTGA